MSFSEAFFGLCMILGAMAIITIVVLLVFKAIKVVKAARAIMAMPLFWQYVIEEIRKGKQN